MKAFTRSIFLLAGYVLYAFTLHAQSPLLNSYPAAGSVLFLDFDGQYVSGGAWNWSGPINAEPSTVDAAGITEIFNRVSEDFRPFDINVTTDSTVYAAAQYNKRMRVIITSTNWYGSVGGVAYVNSFSWGDDTPCWVFSGLLYNNTKWVAEACSHELGHTFGLQHQSTFDATCYKTEEYSGGQGTGEIGWAPIMGVSYYKNRTTWNVGPNASGCNVIQNDVNIIAARVGLRPDEHADTSAAATAVEFTGLGFSVNGLINRVSDVDAFSLDLPSSAVIQLNAIPQNVGSGNEGANIDISVTILDENLDTIGYYNPSALLNAGIDTALNSGKYYLLIKGVGNINHSEYGSLGLYALNGMMLALLPSESFLLKGSNNGMQHTLQWTYKSNIPVKELVVEVSADGKLFSSLSHIGGLQSRYDRFSSSRQYYRVKAVLSPNANIVYSNVVCIAPVVPQAVTINRLVRDKIEVNCKSRHTYRLYDGTGRLLKEGVLQPGVSRIESSNIQKGILFMCISNEVESWTEKLIKQ